MPTRRQFLEQCVCGGAVALGSAMLPSGLFTAAAAQARGNKLLVVLEMAGGNDGLNTFIPYRDPLYSRLRPALAVPSPDVISLDPAIGMHPSLRPLAQLHERGGFAVVLNVGYPEPNRSHFRSLDVWQSGVAEREDTSSGWIGRYAESREGGALQAIGVDLTERPVALSARTAELPVIPADGFRLYTGSGSAAEAKRALRDWTTLDLAGRPALAGALQDAAKVAYRASEQLEASLATARTGAAHPDTPLGRQLRLTAELAEADVGVRIAFLRLGGFDTHAGQRGVHGDLLAQLAEAVSAFFADLKARGLASNVLLMAYSEFGRRVAENASLGTDHGAAGPMFACSGGLRGGVYGGRLDLEDLDEGDLRYKVDFRQVYATVLSRWLEVPVEPVLGREYPLVPFL